MELIITFFTNFTLVVYFILALFFILIILFHLNDDSNRYAISKSVFLSKFLYLKFLLFVNPDRWICKEQQNYLC